MLLRLDRLTLKVIINLKNIKPKNVQNVRRLVKIKVVEIYV